MTDTEQQVAGDQPKQEDAPAEQAQQDQNEKKGEDVQQTEDKGDVV